MTTSNLQFAFLTTLVRHVRHIGVLGSALLLAACANPVDTAAADGDQECVYVRVTGSNLPVKECRSRAERETLAAQNEEAAQQGLRDLRNLDEFGVASPGAESLD